MPEDDREMMLRLLNQAMQTNVKRMECIECRYDSDGRHSESPNTFPGQRLWYLLFHKLMCIQYNSFQEIWNINALIWQESSV